MPQFYRIIRRFDDGSKFPRVTKEGLTLKEAEEHVEGQQGKPDRPYTETMEKMKEGWKR
tara:strand:- start:1669 stop:1845 length:177 start_codon:yes stop_codon:yes gene_type:complete